MITLAVANAIHMPLPDRSVHMIATSPPYWQQRDYGVGAENGELGAEGLHDCAGWATGNSCGECYVCHLRLVAAECWRVLRNDGVFFLNLGDGYAGSGKSSGRTWEGGVIPNLSQKQGSNAGSLVSSRTPVPKGLKPKDLAGIPSRVALALQADGWWWRQTIIWAKDNPMPSNTMDRPTTAHEYIFLLAKSHKYFWDQEAVKEPSEGGFTRHLRSTWIWTIPTQGYSGDHFAAWPERLVEIMIKAGTSEHGCCPTCGTQWQRVTEKGIAQPRSDNPNPVIPYTANGVTNHGTGKTSLHMTRKTTTVGWRPGCEHYEDAVPTTVLDPFAGSCTTGLVARRLGRKSVMLDLSHQYLREEGSERLGFKALQAWQAGTGIPAPAEPAFEPGTLFWEAE